METEKHKASENEKKKQKSTRHQKTKKENRKQKISEKDKRKPSETRINEKGLVLWEGLNLFITSYVSTCKSPHFIAYCCQCIPLPTAAEGTCIFPSELTYPLLLDSLYLLCKSMMNVRLSSASQ